MKGYKGFNPGLVCKDKQYQENTVFEEPEAKICKKGMHFCKNPFDVLDYYDLVRDDGNFNDFAEVEALDDCKTDDDRKFCTKKLKIGVKLSFAGFVKACVDFVLEKTNHEMPSASIDSGDSAQIGSSGNSAKIGSSGDSAQIGSSGDYAKIGSSGYYAKINCAGTDSVICCAGHGSVVKASTGCWITLAEWEYDSAKGRHVPVCVKTEFVDGERIKANTPYTLEKGEFVEVATDGD